MPQRQRQAPAQPGDLADCRVASPAGGSGPATARSSATRRPRGSMSRLIDLRVVQARQMPAAGDQHQACRRCRAAAADLVVPGRVVQHEQRSLAGQALPPQRGPRLRAGRDLRPHSRRHAAGWPAPRPDRRAAGPGCGRAAAGTSARRGTGPPACARRAPRGRSCRCRPSRRSRRCPRSRRRRRGLLPRPGQPPVRSRPVKDVVSLGSVRVAAATAPGCPASGASGADARKAEGWPRAAASNAARWASDRPSASASSRAVSRRAVRLTPRSRSLTDR